MVKKIILSFFVLALLGALAFGFYLKKLITYDKSSEVVYLNISSGDKKILKSLAAALAKIIYREATIHNPEGDLLPDQIDDNIKKEIRKRIQ